MTPEARRQMVLYHEGQVITTGGNHTQAEAIEIARAAVDGIVNGMMRMGGHKETAEYLFALTDRVVGRIKGVTPLPAALFQRTPDPTSLEGRLQAELNEGLRKKAEELSAPPPSRALRFGRALYRALVGAGIIIAAFLLMSAVLSRYMGPIAP